MPITITQTAVASHQHVLCARSALRFDEVVAEQVSPCLVIGGNVDPVDHRRLCSVQPRGTRHDFGQVGSALQIRNQIVEGLAQDIVQMRGNAEVQHHFLLAKSTGLCAPCTEAFETIEPWVDTTAIDGVRILTMWVCGFGSENDGIHSHGPLIEVRTPTPAAAQDFLRKLGAAQ